MAGGMRPRAAHEPYALAPEEWAYIAGFIDGEGCIHALRGRSAGVKVTQVDPRPLVWLHGHLGGHLRRKRTRTGTALAWYLSTAQAVTDLLTHIEPLLLSKREQAQVALQLMGLPRSNGKSAEAQALKDELSRLKKTREVVPSWDEQ